MTTITTTREIHIETCCNCGVVFGMDSFLRKQRLEDHGSFFCTNGHGQHFTGQSEAAKLRIELQENQRQLTAAKTEALGLRMKCEAVEKQKKRIVRRIHAGVCPCCNRTFVKLAAHIKTKHPDFVPSTNNTK